MCVYVHASMCYHCLLTELLQMWFLACSSKAVPSAEYLHSFHTRLLHDLS